jgi:hypothetical protein
VKKIRVADGFNGKENREVRVRASRRTIKVATDLDLTLGLLPSDSSQHGFARGGFERDHLRTGGVAPGSVKPVRLIDLLRGAAALGFFDGCETEPELEWL